jgi:hypothetical protein
MRMGTTNDFVFRHPFFRDGSENSERLERFSVVEDVVDHSAEVVRVVGKGHQLLGHCRRQLESSKRLYCVFFKVTK